METKKVIGFILMFLVLGLVILYWYFPTDPREFKFEPNPSTNFSENSSAEMQFYPNMRFPNKNISYSISEECDIQKKSEMLWAFEILEQETVLSFYENQENAEINVFCEDKTKIENNMFIAGEGGPANVSLGEKFNIIMNGYILLLKKTDCERPNVAIHELLHVLGFEHSDNSKNIMYPVSKCNQVISGDMLAEINRIYATESLPDLAIESVSTSLQARFLDTDLIIENQGLKDSEDFVLEIYADNKSIEKMEIEAIKMSHGRIINITNILIPQIRINTLKFVLETKSLELDKKNNQIILELNTN